MRKTSGASDALFPLVGSAGGRRADESDATVQSAQERKSGSAERIRKAETQKERQIQLSCSWRQRRAVADRLCACYRVRACAVGCVCARVCVRACVHANTAQRSTSDLDMVGYPQDHAQHAHVIEPFGAQQPLSEHALRVVHHRTLCTSGAARYRQRSGLLRYLLGFCQQRQVATRTCPRPADIHARQAGSHCGKQ